MINAYNRGLQQNLKGPELLKYVANTSGGLGIRVFNGQISRQTITRV